MLGGMVPSFTGAAIPSMAGSSMFGAAGLPASAALGEAALAPTSGLLSSIGAGATKFAESPYGQNMLMRGGMGLLGEDQQQPLVGPMQRPQQQPPGPSLAQILAPRAQDGSLAPAGMSGGADIVRARQQGVNATQYLEELRRRGLLGA